jgi:diguanylate cyclase (GGDEF)-like protein/PAS domain S-box-containing protein
MYAMLDKKRTIIRPLTLSSLMTNESDEQLLERELLSRMLDLSRQDLNLASLNANLITVLNHHPLLMDKSMVLWCVNSQSIVTFMASQNVYESLKADLYHAIDYNGNEGHFLKINSSFERCVPSGVIQTDIYLEKTPQYLFGMSFWFKDAESSSKLTTLFFQELFGLINLMLLKISHHNLLQLNMEHQLNIEQLNKERELLYSNQKHSEAMIRELTRAIEQSPVLVMITDKSGTVEYVNRKVLELTGYRSGELVGQNTQVLQSGHTSVETYKTMWEQLARGNEWRGELLNKNKYGSYFWVSATISSLRDDHNEITHYLAVMEDISQKKAYEALLRHQASYDNLTSLPNRFYGYTQLENAIAKAQKYKKKLAILFLDLDEFKQVNDSMGHAAGDILLKTIADRYLALMRAADTIVRLGGDEFMIIVEDLSSNQYAEELAQKCQSLCVHPFKLEEEEVFISSSIGIALYPEHGSDAKTLMSNADAAMYESKMRGKNNWTVFVNTMTEAAVYRIRLKSELYQVLTRDELSIDYQPIINIADQTVFAAEALLRWKSSILGEVLPDQIIPLAEETGFIVPLGYWILKTVCKHIKEWQAATDKTIKIAVNISIVQLKQKDFVEQVQSILDGEGVSPDALIFEITESAFIDDSALILSQLNRLNIMNIDCALDDFGMGYSSLNYLRCYPFKILKIDRAFIQNIDTNDDDLSLVNSIITMSRNLKLSVIAEGIETHKQLELLRSMNCDMVQGWYFSKALSSRDLLFYLNNKDRLINLIV